MSSISKIQVGSTSFDIKDELAQQELLLKENISNKTTNITADSTDEEYSSAKAVWTLFQSSGTNNYEALINLPKINGKILIGDKDAQSLKLRESDEAIKEVFITKYGNITLLDNPYADWEQYVNDMAIELLSGLKHLYVPYSSTMLVEAYIDRDHEYPIQFNWAGKLYGKNSTGIKEIGISPENVVLRSDLTDEVKQILDAGIINAGEM